MARTTLKPGQRLCCARPSRLFWIVIGLQRYKLSANYTNKCPRLFSAHPTSARSAATSCGRNNSDIQPLAHLTATQTRLTHRENNTGVPESIDSGTPASVQYFIISKRQCRRTAGADARRGIRAQPWRRQPRLSPRTHLWRRQPRERRRCRRQPCGRPGQTPLRQWRRQHPLPKSFRLRPIP